MDREEREGRGRMRGERTGKDGQRIKGGKRRRGRREGKGRIRRYEWNGREGEGQGGDRRERGDIIVTHRQRSVLPFQEK